MSENYVVVTPDSIKKFDKHEDAFAHADALDVRPKGVYVVKKRTSGKVAVGINVWANIFKFEQQPLIQKLIEEGYEHQVG